MRLTANADGTPSDRDRAVAVLRRALELGVNHIDTAAFYFSPLRSANELINRALAPYPDDLVITTKVGPGSGGLGGSRRTLGPRFPCRTVRRSRWSRSHKARTRRSGLLSTRIRRSLPTNPCELGDMSDESATTALGTAARSGGRWLYLGEAGLTPAEGRVPLLPGKPDKARFRAPVKPATTTQKPDSPETCVLFIDAPWKTRIRPSPHWVRRRGGRSG
jgi:hypothetical protein